MSERQPNISYHNSHNPRKFFDTPHVTWNETSGQMADWRRRCDRRSRLGVKRAPVVFE
jgi:hypothetical protein